MKRKPALGRTHEQDKQIMRSVRDEIRAFLAYPCYRNDSEFAEDAKTMLEQIREALELAVGKSG